MVTAFKIIFAFICAACTLPTAISIRMPVIFGDNTLVSMCENAYRDPDGYPGDSGWQQARELMITGVKEKIDEQF